MRQQDRELLTEQLREALADLKAGEGEPFEVAVLAGLLARRPDAPADLLAEAEGWRDGEGADALDGAIVEAPIDDIVDRVVAADEDDDAAERLDALFDLDELCAGASWAHASFRVADGADLVARTVEAFPAAWRDLADAATELLKAAPPRPEDPARRIWARVEATRWHSEPETTRRPQLERARRELGLARSVSIGRVRPWHADLPAAAEALPAASPWEPAARGESWELALTTDDSGAAILCLTGVAGTRIIAARNGQPVALAQPRDNAWTCRAEPGAYVFTIGSETCEVQVTE